MSSNSALSQQPEMDESKAGVNLHKRYSKLNESLTALFDGMGVKRTFTVPYVEGQDTSDHIKAVGATAQNAGGLTNNLVTTSHRSNSKGWGHGDGETVGHSAPKLRETIIPTGNEDAKKVIDAAQSFLTAAHSLIGNDNSVMQAQAQLDLVKRHDGAGMNLMDFGVLAQQIIAAPLKAVARAHNGLKQNSHSPKIAPPRHGMPVSTDDNSQPPTAPPQQTAPAAAPPQTAAPQAQQ